MTAPAPSRRTSAIAFGVSSAIAVYAATLALQRHWPWLRSALALTLSPSVTVTYYCRVVVSLAVGALVAACGSRLSIAEGRLAWMTATIVCLGIGVAAIFP